MKMITLLCINPLEDYELIDCELLNQQGIKALFVFKEKTDNQTIHDGALIKSYEYEDIFSLCKSIRPDYIACFSEDLFVVVAKIRMALDIDGMDLSNAMLLSHKNLMYEKLKNSLPYPNTTRIGENDNFNSLKTQLNSNEIFIKPINASGSYETYHVKDEKNYQQYLLNKKKVIGEYIAQPYINAELYHSELAIFNGDIILAYARKYSYPNHLMVSQNLPIFSLNIMDDVRSKIIIEASIKVKELLGINNGILHTEFFMDEEGNINFIETNARPPGIGLNRMYKQKLSISLETILCFIVCGLKPPEIKDNPNYFICGYYPIKPGVIKTITQPKLNVESEWKLYVKPNDSSEQIRHMSKSAMFICWDKCETKVNEASYILAGHDVVEIY